MLLAELKPDVIVRGPIFPGPVQVIISIPMGASVKLVGKGLVTGQVHEPMFDADQVATLEATPQKAPFDGDPQRFRLGIEALRLVWLMSTIRITAEQLADSESVNSMGRIRPLR